MTGCYGGALITIGAQGCAVAAQATIATEFLNKVIDPEDINSTVATSCSYYGGDFKNAYPLDIGWNTSAPDLAHRGINGFSRQSIISLFGPLILSGKLIIMRANEKNPNTGVELTTGHYEVIDKALYDIYYYEYDTKYIYRELYMNDSSNRDFTIGEFLARYPFPKFGDIFTDKR